LVGYRTGSYSAHARIAHYEIGAGFDPLRYGQTLSSDWAMLTVTETLPEQIEPLRLRRSRNLGGTKAILAGYPRDRAFAMSADRNCELQEDVSALLLHTCLSTKGYSGGPILVSVGDGEMQIAGIQIASLRTRSTEIMIAIPAEAIWSQSVDEVDDDRAYADRKSDVCRLSDGVETRLEDIADRIDPDQMDTGPEFVSSIPSGPADMR